MELKQQFEQVMNTWVNMALATSVEDKANVRMVTFAYDNNQPGKIFFCTFKGNQKIAEFQKNPQVTCLPLPPAAETDLQVRIFGHVQESNLTLDQLIAMIALKYPGSAETMKMGGDMMAIYEVCFKEAMVTVGMAPAQAVKV